VTLSFNLKAGMSIGEAANAIRVLERQLGKPASLATSFQGNAQAFESSLSKEPVLIAAAIVVIYIILGTGTGSEIRQSLGYTIVGGLLLSQLLSCTRRRWRICIWIG